MNSDWKHDIYKKHFPDGFELIWLEGEDLKTNKEFLAACELNAKIAETEKKKKQEKV